MWRTSCQQSSLDASPAKDGSEVRPVPAQPSDRDVEGLEGLARVVQVPDQVG